MPRIVAAVISMPLLVAIADSIGVFGGYVAATQALGFNGAMYLNNTVNGVGGTVNNTLNGVNNTVNGLLGK